tara:strand:- start:53 stop:502 length:450 start_codon:yes stop_codon:yes gene_type:complete
MGNKNLSDYQITSDVRRATISSNRAQYTDIDISLEANPFTKDISVLRDDRAIVGAVRNLILTNFFERPFAPLKGGNLSGFLFEPADNITKAGMRDAISRVITEHEPRVNLTGINIIDKPDDNAYDITVRVLIREANIEADVQIQLTRLR